MIGTFRPVFSFFLLLKVLTHIRGGAVVYRTALWHPDLVTHAFVIGTPFTPPNHEFIDLQTLVSTRLPNFGYQLQFAGTELEPRIKTKEDIRQFLLTLYGGRTPEGEVGFDIRKGLLLEKLGKIGMSKLFSEEELGYYVDEFSRNGVHGPREYFSSCHLLPQPNEVCDKSTGTARPN